MKNTSDVISHYNSLIDENNDPMYDSSPLKEYMNKWDGQAFIDELQLNLEKSVLEIGVGTGRLAVHVAPLCKEFTGIDISPKTIERAKGNLSGYKNVELICDDCMTHRFNSKFDIIYSSLTFMHVENKQIAINKIADLMTDDGRFVLSIDKNQCEYIDMGTRKIKIYPDNPYETAQFIKESGLQIEKQFETEFAHIFVAVKGA